MDRTHPDSFLQPKITGYRQLSPTEAALMNEIKELAGHVGALVHRLRAMPATGFDGVPFTNESGHQSIDQRWVSIGATELQQGFMALTRAVAQPTTF